MCLTWQSVVPDMAGIGTELGWLQDNWSEWADSPSPQTLKPPGRFSTCRPIVKLLLLKVRYVDHVDCDVRRTRAATVTGCCPGLRVLVFRHHMLREDCVRAGIAEFVRSHLGPSFVTSPPASMADVFADTDCRTPCVFVLSQVRALMRVRAASSAAW